MHLSFSRVRETGQGRIAADGVIGLGRAFLEAGARAVVLSLWESTRRCRSHLVDPFLSRPPAVKRVKMRRRLCVQRCWHTRADLEAGRISANGQAPLLPIQLLGAVFRAG